MEEIGELVVGVFDELDTTKFVVYEEGECTAVEHVEVNEECFAVAKDDKVAAIEEVFEFDDARWGTCGVSPCTGVYCH